MSFLSQDIVIGILLALLCVIGIIILLSLCFCMYLLGRNSKVSNDYPSLTGSEECVRCSRIASRRSHLHTDDEEYPRRSHRSHASHHSSHHSSRHSPQHSSCHSSHRSHNSVSSNSSNVQNVPNYYPDGQQGFYVPSNNGSYPAAGQYPCSYPMYPAPSRPQFQRGPPMQYVPVQAPPGAYPYNEQHPEATEMTQHWVKLLQPENEPELQGDVEMQQPYGVQSDVMNLMQPNWAVTDGDDADSAAAVGGASQLFVQPVPLFRSASIQKVKKRERTLKENQLGRTPSQTVVQPDPQSESRSPSQIAALPSAQRLAGLSKKPSRAPPNAPPRQRSAVGVKEQSNASAQDKSTSSNVSSASASTAAPKTPKAADVVAERSTEKREVRAAPPQTPQVLQSEGTEPGADERWNASEPTQSALNLPFD